MAACVYIAGLLKTTGKFWCIITLKIEKTELHNNFENTQLTSL